MGQQAITLLRQLDDYIYEPVNCLTHLLGALASVFGMVALLVVVWGDPLSVFSFGVYGLSSVLLYLASSLFHGLKVGPERRRLLLKLDHVGIFALIAGSYTPLALISLKNHSTSLGWTFFFVVWGFATLGIVFKLRWLDAPRWLSTLFYVLLGWAAVFAMPSVAQALSVWGVSLLLLGGLLYSVGAVVFVLQRPNLYPGILGHHELWHLFVLAGGACHYLMLFLFVAPS